MSENKKVKAVVMVSGGLDSLLAVKTLEAQGIEVFAVNFDMGYSQGSHHKQVPPKKIKPNGIDIMREAGVHIVSVNVAKDFFHKVILNPKHGYGKAVNPCIDCKIYMQKKASEYAKSIGADFIATGEVVGQRPMSQMLQKMMVMEREGGLERQILRPLSAKLLPITIPEETGLVDREKLHGISGRGRYEQMRLAREYGIDKYETPAGGCFLAEKELAQRMFDLFDAGEKANPDFYEFQLLKTGSHFRLSPTVKLIRGRNRAENKYLADILQLLEKEAVGLDAEDIPGPFVVLIGEGWQDVLDIALGITARYADKHQDIEIKLRNKKLYTIGSNIATGLSDDEIKKYRIG